MPGEAMGRPSVPDLPGTRRLNTRHGAAKRPARGDTGRPSAPDPPANAGKNTNPPTHPPFRPPLGAKVPRWRGGWWFKPKWLRKPGRDI